MRVFFWRAALITILLVTLLGSIVLLIAEPSLGSILGVIGSVGSLMGAFVTTGLDIASTRAVPQVPQPSLAHTVPHDYQVVIPTKRRKGINFAAITQAATLGALGLGTVGLLYAFYDGSVWVLAMCCAQFTGFFAIGALYVIFARADLPREESVSMGLGLVGGLASGLIPAVVSVIANQLSEWMLFPAHAAALQAEFDYYGFDAVDIVTGLTLTICIAVIFGVVISGAGGMITAAILRQRK